MLATQRLDPREYGRRSPDPRGEKPCGLWFGIYDVCCGRSLPNAPSTEGSSEIDISDMFLALGLAGGCTYLLAVYLILRDLGRYVRSVPLRVGLPVLAIAVEMSGSWLTGNQYSTTATLFFIFGALVFHQNQDRMSAMGREPPAYT